MGVNATMASGHPSQRAVDLSRANPLWGNHDHSFVRGPVHPYTTRDYYAPESRYSIEGPARFGWAGYAAGPAGSGANYGAFGAANNVANGNGHYGHPVGPQGMYNVASGHPTAYGPYHGAYAGVAYPGMAHGYGYGNG